MSQGGCSIMRESNDELIGNGVERDRILSAETQHSSWLRLFWLQTQTQEVPGWTAGDMFTCSASGILVPEGET